VNVADPTRLGFARKTRGATVTRWHLSKKASIVLSCLIQRNKCGAVRKAPAATSPAARWVADVESAPDALLTRHGVPVVFRTLAEAEATAEDLRHERHTRGTANYHYWVVDCPSGEHAGTETHASFP
jgi:hypothetical protein